MKPVEFPQQNMVLAKDQPQYTPLPCHCTKESQIISAWLPTAEELKQLNEGKPLWLWVWTFGQPFPPVQLGTENPWEPAKDVQHDPKFFTRMSQLASGKFRKAVTAAQAFNPKFFRGEK